MCTSMGSEKPTFLSQPVVKNIFMFRNGDPYYEARRLVINQRRVCNFETFLREVTGGIQAPFGAVRNIYTPRGGHKVDCLDSLKSGEQYVAAGKERFKKLNYLQIGSRKRRLLQALPMQAKPHPPNRISVSARFLKPIKEPCPIFVVANGDTMDPAVRLLIHQRMLSQFEKILEMITEKMGLRVLGGVRSLYTHEGQQVTDGTQLESGQLYVAVGRERFKRLSYADLLFSKPRWAQRVNGMKMGTLPPIYRASKQNGNRKSAVRSTDSGDGESKASPLNNNGSSREHLSAIVREISQARLLSLRLKRSGQSITLCDNDDLDSKTDDADIKSPDPSTEEDRASDYTKSSEESGEKAEEKKDTPAENTSERDTSVVHEEKADKETNSLTKGGAEEENDAEKNANEGEATLVSEELAEEVKEVKEEVVHEDKGASDESRVTSDETEEVLGQSKEMIEDDSKEKNADVSEEAENVSKDASGENMDETSDEQKEKVLDVSKEAMVDENKDKVGSDCTDECTNKSMAEVSNESKQQDATDSRGEVSDEKTYQATNESKNESGDQFASECNEEVADSNESKDEHTNDNNNDVSGEEVTNKAPNESKDEVANETVNAVINESKDEVANETVNAVINESKDEVANETVNAVINESKDEVANETVNAVINENKNEIADDSKSITSSGAQQTGHNGDTKGGQNEGNDSKGNGNNQGEKDNMEVPISKK